MAKRLAMQVEFQKCRSWRHAWDDFIPDRSMHPTIYESPLQETLRCLRCGTERYRGIGWAGEVETNVYDYAEGYLMDADSSPSWSSFVCRCCRRSKQPPSAPRPATRRHATQSAASRAMRNAVRRSAPERGSDIPTRGRCIRHT